MRLIREGEALRARDVAFDARLVLIDSAQVFHWREEGAGAFVGAADGRCAHLTQLRDGFLLEGDVSDAAFWNRYFDLDRDYGRLFYAARNCPAALEALRLLPGLRVLRQPPWEALVAFIVSANNNVARIRKIVGALIATLGENGAFPTPGALVSAGEDALRALGCGYRAPYLVETARRVEDGFDLDAVSRLDYKHAHERLLTLPGVGDKVADCVQLFGMGQSMAFPVDVWVERMMKSRIAPDAKDKKSVQQAAWALFGEEAGLIQQSLFHCARLGLIDLSETDGRMAGAC